MSQTEQPPDPQHRLAAIASLLAGVAAMLVALAFTFKSLGSVLLAVLGIAIAVSGGWHAVCKRGTGRVLGVAVAAAGLLLAVAGLLMAHAGLLGLVIAVGLAGFSVACARKATGRRNDATVAADLAPPAPAARRGVLIMNLKSGGGKAESNDLVDACREQGITPVVLSPGDDLSALAEEAIAGGADVIGMAGGDGSLAIVAGVAARHDVPFVVVPAGTRNHFALDLGLDRDDVLGALAAYHGGIARTVDLARVNDRTIVNNASLGVYAEIVASESYRDAKVRTTLDALPDLLGPTARTVPLELVGLTPQPRPGGQIVLVSNNPYTFDSFDGLGTRARLDTGRLGVVSVTVGGADDARRLLAFQAAHELSRFHGWEEWQTQRFRVESPEPLAIAIDGEALTLDPPLTFEIVPAALTVLLPPQAPGRSPAARSMGWDVPGQLWSIARGKSPVTSNAWG